jgi:AcrR family transcriptional regulator
MRHERGRMSARRRELTREAARLFAQKGYHGTSIGDIAEALGVQKGSLYAHIASKEDLLYETMREGANAFHAALDAIPDDLPAVEKIRLALRGHLRVVAEQLDVATVFVQEWRYLEGERRDEIVAERRRYEERIRELFREGRELSELRADLDESAAALLLLSAANWAYTWRHRRARRPLLRATRGRNARVLDSCLTRQACSAACRRP